MYHQVNIFTCHVKLFLKQLHICPRSRVFASSHSCIGVDIHGLVGVGSRVDSNSFTWPAIGSSDHRSPKLATLALRSTRRMKTSHSGCSNTTGRLAHLRFISNPIRFVLPLYYMVHSGGVQNTITRPNFTNSASQLRTEMSHDCHLQSATGARLNQYPPCTSIAWEETWVAGAN